MAWRIEYTNHPWLKKTRKKILEKAVAEAMEEIDRLLQQERDGGFMLGETVFSVESTWLPDLKKKKGQVQPNRTDYVGFCSFCLKL